MKRLPFRMRPSDRAQARYTFTDSRGKERTVLKSGRASFVWLHAVLVTLASGLTDKVEIRKSHESPWHTIDYTADEAFDLIVEHYPMQRGLRRAVEAHRRKRGLALRDKIEAAL